MLKHVEFYSRFTYPDPTLTLKLDPLLYYYPELGVDKKPKPDVFLCSEYDGIGEYDGAGTSVYTTGGYAYPNKQAKSGRNIMFQILPTDGMTAWTKRQVSQRLPKEEILIKLITTEVITDPDRPGQKTNETYWTRAWLTDATFPTFGGKVYIELNFTMQIDHFVRQWPIFKTNASYFTIPSPMPYGYSGPIVGGFKADHPNGGAEFGDSTSKMQTLKPKYDFAACGCLGHEPYGDKQFFTYMYRPAQISWYNNAGEIEYDSAIKPGSEWIYREVVGNIPPISGSLTDGWTFYLYATEYVL